jgi:hypothetical protein
MKNFLLGFLAAIVVLACFVFGALFILGEKVEESLNTPWEEKLETELQLSFYPTADIELSNALGFNAQKMADFLSKGNEQKRKSYLSILNSGLDIEIESHYGFDGPSRMQRVHFRDGKVENNIIESVVKVELLRDDIADQSIEGSTQLSDAIEQLRASADLQRSSVDLLQKKIDTEPVDADNPVYPPENSKNQLDD